MESESGPLRGSSKSSQPSVSNTAEGSGPKSAGPRTPPDDERAPTFPTVTVKVAGGIRLAGGPLPSPAALPGPAAGCRHPGSPAPPPPSGPGIRESSAGWVMVGLWCCRGAGTARASLRCAGREVPGAPPCAAPRRPAGIGPTRSCSCRSLPRTRREQTAFISSPSLAAPPAALQSKASRAWMGPWDHQAFLIGALAPARGPGGRRAGVD